MAAFGSEERSEHEQLPAASIQKVAIVHGYIIPYLMQISNEQFVDN